MFRLASVSLGILILVSAALPQRGAPNEELYSAIATGWVTGSRAVPFDFLIKSYASENEWKHFARMLNESGPSALRTELENKDAGLIHRVDGVEDHIAIAGRATMGRETVITVITARNMPFAELFEGEQTAEYPLGVLQVTLNEDGIGSGKILFAAKIQIDEQNGKYKVESYRGYYIKAVNVRLINGRPSHPLRSTCAGCKLAATFIRNELGRTEARREQ